MKKTLQIQDGLILICGPSTSGKTTLAQRLFDEIPYTDKVLLSHDEFLRDFLKRTGRPVDTFYAGLDSEGNSKFKEALAMQIRDACARRQCIIHESLYCVPENLETLLRILPAFGLNRPVTLIKLWPSLELWMQFLRKRPDRERVDMRALLSQRVSFQPSTVERFFSKKVPWVHEYCVEDPRVISFEFKKKGELTSELMASYEEWETCWDKAPDFMQFIATL